MNRESDPPRYREIQRWSDVWLVMVIVMAVAAIQWWSMIQQFVHGGLSRPDTATGWLMIILWLALGVGLPILAFWLRLVVEVYPDKIVINYRPFAARTVIMPNVISVEPRVFGPVPAFSGWGGHGQDNIRAYNVSGPTSVQLILRDRSRLLIGTHSPDRLAAAIAAARFDVRK